MAYRGAVLMRSVNASHARQSDNLTPRWSRAPPRAGRRYRVDLRRGRVIATRVVERSDRTTPLGSSLTATRQTGVTATSASYVGLEGAHLNELRRSYGGGDARWGYGVACKRWWRVRWSRRLMVARWGDVNGGGSGSSAPTHRILGHAGSRAASDVTWHT